MIDFEQVWLPQIVSYAKLISSGQLQDEWLGYREAGTSITDPDELHEQIFDDLDSDFIWGRNRSRRSLRPEAVRSIGDFLASLRNINESDARLLVPSAAWTKAKQAADAVVANVS